MPRDWVHSIRRNLEAQRIGYHLASRHSSYVSADMRRRRLLIAQRMTPQTIAPAPDATANLGSSRHMIQRTPSLPHRNESGSNARRIVADSAILSFTGMVPPRAIPSDSRTRSHLANVAATTAAANTSAATRETMSGSSKSSLTVTMISSSAHPVTTYRTTAAMNGASRRSRRAGFLSNPDAPDDSLMNGSRK